MKEIDRTSVFLLYYEIYDEKSIIGVYSSKDDAMRDALILFHVSRQKWYAAGDAHYMADGMANWIMEPFWCHIEQKQIIIKL